MRKWNLPLTYWPKIQPVIDGKIRQTIRLNRKFSIGDLIRFYTWRAQPYHSKRDTITGYTPLILVIPATIYQNGIWISPGYKLPTVGFCEWHQLDWLAVLDGIIPSTGKELGKVLMEKNDISPCGNGAQIIRW